MKNKHGMSGTKTDTFYRSMVHDEDNTGAFYRDDADNTAAFYKDDEDKGKGIPGIRKVCEAGGVVLYDGQTKYPFFNQENHISHPFPFVAMKNMGSAHEFWGRPEPRRLKHLNLAMDRISSQVMDNVHLMSNPMWVVDQTADVQDQIHNQPGLSLIHI